MIGSTQGRWNTQKSWFGLRELGSKWESHPDSLCEDSVYDPPILHPYSLISGIFQKTWPSNFVPKRNQTATISQPKNILKVIYLSSVLIMLSGTLCVYMCVCACVKMPQQQQQQQLSQKPYLLFKRLSLNEPRRPWHTAYPQQEVQAAKLMLQPSVKSLLNSSLLDSLIWNDGNQQYSHFNGAASSLQLHSYCKCVVDSDKWDKCVDSGEILGLAG